MSLNETPVIVTLPFWYVERLSSEIEIDVREYELSVKWAMQHGTPEQLTRISANRARYEAVETAINDALLVSEAGA